MRRCSTRRGTSRWTRPPGCEWLIARHVEFGKTPEEARAWVMRSDEANAAVVAATREHADVVVRLAT